MANRILPALAVLAVLAGMIAVFFVEDRPGAEPAASSATAARVQVPAITLPQADGGTFSSAAHHGKSPIILSFFATW
jgi:hypothetical protein